MNKPIPAFYACYLLRSAVRHASLYVGSTPNPIRRLRQHNGDTKGGAARTSRDSLRPWEMTCLVTGFPSKVAALQFEWAWQNTHLTRHISPNTRITQSRTAVRISPKTGRLWKRPAKPRLSLTDRLANLHLLLRASSFERWPLNVIFYSEDVYRVWQKWTQQGAEPLRSGIEVTLDDSARAANALPPSGALIVSNVQGIDVGYAPLKQHLENAKNVLATASWCTVCSEQLPTDGAMTLVCPNASCQAAAHLSCLASSFSGRRENVVPTTGLCPGCGTELRWIDLVKELSLRIRGGAEVQKLFKVRKPRGTKQNGAAETTAPVEDEPSEDEHLPEDDLPYLSISDESEPELSKPTMTSRNFPATATTFSADPFVEDSDWDDAEVIT